MPPASNRFAKYVVQPDDGGGSAAPAPKTNRFSKYAAPVPTNPNAPNPITTAMRASTDKVNADFAERRQEETLAPRKVSRPEAASRGISQGLTFGLSDEAAGVAAYEAELRRRGYGQTVGDYGRINRGANLTAPAQRMGTRQEAEAAAQAAAEKAKAAYSADDANAVSQHPVTSIAGQFGGAALNPTSWLGPGGATNALGYVANVGKAAAINAGISEGAAIANETGDIVQRVQKAGVAPLVTGAAFGAGGKIIFDTAGKGLQAGYNALTNAGRPRPGPVGPSHQPSPAPPAQPRPASPGQGAGAAQPVLNATRVQPPAGPAGYTHTMAKSDAKIIGRLLREANVPGDNVKPLLTDTVRAYQDFVTQSHQRGEQVRLTLSMFAEDYLATKLSPDIAKDVAVKLRAFGNVANNSADTAKAVVQRTAEELRGSQETYLSNIFNKELGDKSLHTTKGDIRGAKKLNAEAVYKTELDKGDAAFKAGTATPKQVEAKDKLLARMSEEEFFSKIPYELKVKAANDPAVGGLWEYINQRPLDAAHWLQSQLGVLARKGGENARAYHEMRMALVRPIEDAVDGYRGARMRAGDLAGQDIAIHFGDDLFRNGMTDLQTQEMALEYKKLSAAQREVADRSIRDKLKNEFRRSREDSIDPVTGARVDSRGAFLTNLQKAGTLEVIEKVLGDRGKRIADGIRNIMRENPRIPSYGSDSAKNIAERKAIESAVKSPFNKAVEQAGDKTSFAWTVPADIAAASVGAPPVFTASKLAGMAIERFGKPSAKQMGSAAKTLYSLPPTPRNALSPPAAPRRTPPPPRTGPRPPVTEADIQALRNQYDALNHGRAPKKSEELARKIVNAEKRLAAQQQAALSGPPKPPTKAGLGAAPEAIGATGGGVAGYYGAQDTNGDGVVDDNERRAQAVGGMFTGAIMARAGRAGVNKLNAGRPKGPPVKPFAPKPVEAPLKSIDMTADGYERVSQIGNATLKYSVNPDKTMSLEVIEVPQSARGQGQAGSALDKLLAEADAKGLTVYVEPRPIGNAAPVDMSPQALKAQGFNVDEPLYHGSMSTQPFDSFDVSKAGRGQGSKRENAIWFSPDKTVASAFSFREPIPAYVRGKIKEVDANRASYLDANIADMLEQARKEGYAGVRIKNMYEGINSPWSMPGNDALRNKRFLDQIAIFDPKNIIRTDKPPANGLTKPQLEQFYAKRGFTKQAGGTGMVRSPNAPKPANDTLPKGQQTPAQDLAMARAFNKEPLTAERAYDFWTLLKDETDPRKIMDVLDMNLDPAILRVPRGKAMVERAREEVLRRATSLMRKETERNKTSTLSRANAKMAENNRSIANEITQLRERGVPDQMIARSLGLEDGSLEYFLNQSASTSKPPPAQAGFGQFGRQIGPPRPPGMKIPAAAAQKAKAPQAKKGPPMSRAAEEATRELKAARSAYNRASAKWVMKDDIEQRVKPLEERVVAAEANLARVLKNDARIKTAGARVKAVVASPNLRVPAMIGVGGGLTLGGGIVGLAAMNDDNRGPKPPNPRDPDFYWNEIVTKNEGAMSQVQLSLDDWGVWPEDQAVTGGYGKITRAAINRWRADRGLDPDAPMTKADVERLLAGPKGYQDAKDKTWRRGDQSRPELPR